MLATALVCILTALPAMAGTIRFRSGPVATGEKSPAELRDSLRPMQSRGADRRVVMQFVGPLSQDQRRRLREGGIGLLSYLGDHAYFVRIDPRVFDAEDAAALGVIEDVLPVATEWKLHPLLLDGRVPTWAITDLEYLRSVEQTETAAERAAVALPADPLVAVHVLFHPDVPLTPMGPIRVAMHGGHVISILKSVNGLVVEMPFSRVTGLAAEGDVQYVEPALPRMQEVNDSSRNLVGADIVQGPPYDIDGSGVTVMVYDLGTVFASHQDFGGRVTVGDGSSIRDHATHVAGTLGGDGSVSGGVYKGVAPGVMIESYGIEQAGGSSPGLLYSDPADLEADYDDAMNARGAVIANNSIGSNIAERGDPCEWTGDYGVTSALIDAIVRGSLGAPMRIVWSNGNERATDVCGDTYKTTAPPACAKNHITVGAVNSNDDTMTDFSSWGPSDDGRLKPDVVGPGCQTNDDMSVTSTSQAGGYTTLCGTSMSAPVVTGIGALLLQDYRSLYPAQPDFRNSTLKTILAHTAVDLGNPGPDFQFGYGSVRAQPAVDLLRSGAFLEAAIDQDEVFPAFLEVPPGTSEIKVTVAWDDPPGTPNVSPALINDLDLVVIDPGGVEHDPWTLDPAIPANPAVRSGPDRLNNIEQVLIDSPAPGVYRLEVRGYAVADGPQVFSLAATPAAAPCSSTGSITLHRLAYPCEAAAVVNVIDCDLNTDDEVVETVMVIVDSSSEPLGETLMLTETAPDSADFQAAMPLSEVDAPGVLAVTHGDTITATYVDADDGGGGVNVAMTDSAAVDCIDPTTTLVQTGSITPDSATIQVDVDEPTVATVHYGTDCAMLDQSVTSPDLQASHTFDLVGLLEDTTYLFVVELEDAVGNVSFDDNGGACHSFKTEIRVDSFTELFNQGDFDLDGYSLIFDPDGSIDFYQACLVPVSGLPVSTANATTINIPDDAYVQVALTGGATAPFYGVGHSSLFIGSNGYITFVAGDDSRHESFVQHFSLPRIAMLFDDLNPAAGGRVSWQQLGDRVVVTFEDVPRFNTPNSPNSFQIEVFFSGELRLTWSDISVTNALAGLSRGEGPPSDFLESDLSAEPACLTRHPDAVGSVKQVINVLDMTVNLNASDDGLPDPPAALSYVVTALPAGEVRDESNDHVIDPFELPYTLNAGNTLRYTPAADLVSTELLRFHVNDGGMAPSAGDSNPAIVLIDVVAPIPGDVDFDGTVGIFDLLALLTDWGACAECPSDINDDGVVSIEDLLILLANWGETLPAPPPPSAANGLMPPNGGGAGDTDGTAKQMAAGPDVQAASVFLNDGLLEPANHGGVVEIDGDYHQTGRGELRIEVWGTRPVEAYDVLVINGRAKLDGLLTVLAGDSYVPRIGDRFVVVAADELQNEFAWYDLPQPPRHGRYVVEYGERAVDVRIEPMPRRGRGTARIPLGRRGAAAEFDGSDRVAIADVVRLLDAWGTDEPSSDVNRNGVVDADDLLLLLEAIAD